jgi:hypothetical protein
MASQPLLNLNQFGQQPVLGMAAFGAPQALNVIQAVVSATGTPTLYSGQAIKYDATITTTPSAIPPIVAAAGTAYADGYILYDVQNGGGITQAQVCQIVLQGVLWMLAESTVSVGDIVQDGADVGGVATYGTSTYYPRGVSLDYGTVGQLIRVNLSPFTIKASATAAHV